jgi:hypothetical protein
MCDQCAARRIHDRNAAQIIIDRVNSAHAAKSADPVASMKKYGADRRDAGGIADLRGRTVHAGACTCACRLHANFTYASGFSRRDVPEVCLKLSLERRRE